MMKKAIDILMDEVDGRGECIECLEKMTGLMASTTSRLIDMLILARYDEEFLESVDFNELYELQLHADDMTRDIAPEYLKGDDDSYDDYSDFFCDLDDEI